MADKRNDYYRTYYDDRSAYWDSVYKTAGGDLSIYAVHFKQRRERILKIADALGLARDSNALDAGCGPGAYLTPLLEKGFRVSAVDQSAGMVEKARENFSEHYADRVRLTVSSLESLPFANEEFDLALNVAVLMYVSGDAHAIAEIYRVLKPGGTLIITVDNKRDLADMLDLPMRLRRLWRRWKPMAKNAIELEDRPATLKPRNYSPNELKHLLRSAGFVIDEEESIGFAPFLLNGKRIFSDAVDLRLDRLLQTVRFIPRLRLTGYTYLCRCHRPLP